MEEVATPGMYEYYGARSRVREVLDVSEGCSSETEPELQETASEKPRDGVFGRSAWSSCSLTSLHLIGGRPKSRSAIRCQRDPPDLEDSDGEGEKLDGLALARLAEFGERRQNYRHRKRRRFQLGFRRISYWTQPDG